MDFDLIAECTRYLKENPEGVKEMSRIMEEMMHEVEYRKAVEIAKHLIARGKHTLEEIAEDTGLTLFKVQELAALK